MMKNSFQIKHLLPSIVSTYFVRRKSSAGKAELLMNWFTWLMMIPNLIAILLLWKVIKAETNDYFHHFYEHTKSGFQIKHLLPSIVSTYFVKI